MKLKVGDGLLVQAQAATLVLQARSGGWLRTLTIGLVTARPAVLAPISRYSI
jgi:hypothetical protein